MSVCVRVRLCVRVMPFFLIDRVASSAILQDRW